MGGNGPGGYGETGLEAMEKQAWRAMEKQAWRAWRNKPGGYGETSLDGMEKQAWRLWRNDVNKHDKCDR